MTYKRKYQYNASNLSDKRFRELVSLGEVVCRNLIVDYTNSPEDFGSVESLKSVILGIAPRQIGISIKSSKNDKIRLIEEEIVKTAALNLFEEFCAFASIEI